MRYLTSAASSRGAPERYAAVETLMERLVFEDSSLRITMNEGDGETAVVAFSGIEHEFKQIPREEFVKTLSGLSPTQYFVVDKNRTWYNGCAEQVLAILTEQLSTFSKVVTLGNSMGGFGAVYFAARLPNCSAGIAFVPQFSIDPTVVPDEKRWRVYRTGIPKIWITQCVEGGAGDIPIHVFFGAAEEKDHMHEALFRAHATAGMAIYDIEEAGHNAAVYLRRHDLLRPILDAVILERAPPERIGDLMRAANVKAKVWRRTQPAAT